MADWKNRIVGYSDEPPDQLLASPYNWRIHPKHQQDALLGVLREAGIVQNILVNRTTGNLIDGHLRVSLALREGQETIPVTWVELSEPEEKLILASFDTISALAGADKEKLDALLRDTKPADAALEQMLSELAAREGLYTGNGAGTLEDTPEPQIDRAAELQEKWDTQIGQLWVIESKIVHGKSHRLVCGDSRNHQSIHYLLDGTNPSLACSDPPYGINVDTRWLTTLHVQRGKPANVSDDRLQGDDGSLDASCAFSFPRWIVWGFPYVAHPQASGWLVWDKWPGVEDGGGLGNPVEMASTNLWTGFRLVRVMWGGYYKAAGEHREPHPTQKPIGVVTPYIEQFSKPGEVIVDLFVGSGTTITACERLGRIGYGCDLEPKYIAVTLQRLQDMGLTPQLVES